MVATKHIRSSPPAARLGGSSAAGTDNPAAESLLRQAAALVLRAPELTVVFAERAAALAEAAGSDQLWVRAEALAVSGRVRLGLRTDTVGRAVAALRAAEDLDDPSVAAGLRTDLAICARSVGVPLMGLAAVRPVLAVAGFTGAGKAAALSQLVGCLSQFGRKPELDRTLAEADKLSGSDDDLDGDDRLLMRALVRVAMSAHRRRHVDVLGAGDAARTGLGLLDQLDDPTCDGGVVRVRLILHLVCSLLDRGDTENARDIAETLLAEPPRAASVAPLGWLRMAVATRVLLPAGAVEGAGIMLRDAVHSTERHGLYSLNSRLWAELAHVEERLGRAPEAIECLHQSRAAEHVYARSRRQAMGLLAGEFGHGGHAAVDLDEILGSSSGSTASVAGAGAPETVAVEEDRPAVSAGRRAAEVVESSTPERAVPAVLPARVEKRVASVASRTWHEDTSVAPTAVAKLSESVPRVQVGPVQVEQVSPDEPPLAPPPAADPPAHKDAETGDLAARVETLSALVGDAAARDERGSRDSETAGEVAETAKRASENDDRTEERPKRKTRHDSEHGSVAARSVLDRLGISPGAAGSGGRRRAAGEPGGPVTSAETPAVNGTNGHSHTSATKGDQRSAEADELHRQRAESRDAANGESTVEESVVEGTEQAAENVAAGAAPATADAGSANAGTEAVTADPETADPETATADAGPDQKTSPDAGAGTSVGDAAGSGAAAVGESDIDQQAAVQDPWLPRLRLPPSLEPFEDVSDDAEQPTPETPFTSTPVISDDFGDSFPREYRDAPPLDEELPADAGLADLLARALAEHQAGTTSAAALVKRLGNQATDEPHTVNGHNHTNGESPNGRHRGGRDR